MKRKLEVSAKKVEDAIADGLQQLNLTLDDVDVKIVSAGGFLKKAKVELYYGEELPEPAEVPAGKHETPDKPLKPAAKPTDSRPGAKPEERIPGAGNAERKRSAPKNEGAKPAAASVSGPVTEKPPRRQSDAKRDEKTEQQPSETAPHWGSQPNFNREPKLMTELGKDPAAGESRLRQPAGGGEERRNNPNNGGGEERRNNPNNGGGKRQPLKRTERESVDPTEEQTAAAVAFLSGLLQKMGVEAQIETKIEDGLRLNLVTEDSRIIGYRGETLDAMQYLVSLTVNTSPASYVHVSLDGLNYRDKRKGTLEGLASRMAEKAVKTGRKVILEPMNSSDRRVIHAVLGESEEVVTRSEGHEPMRRVVILPKKHD